MEPALLIGILVAILAIVVTSIVTGFRKKKSSAALSSGLVAGLITGTLIGGTSTVGTAQLAYNYGMSAWHFTLGAGFACIVLLLFYIKPFRNSGSKTQIGILSNAYGEKLTRVSGILNIVGKLINVMAQILAGSAVLIVIFQQLGMTGAIFITAAFMVLYVIFGGTKGASIVGIIKTFLMYFTMVIAGLIALKLIGGLSATSALMDSFSAETGRNFKSLFCRGFGTDFGSFISPIIGVVCTELYVQSIIGAKNEKAARTGVLICVLLTTFFGLFGIMVGLYMRSIATPAELAENAAGLAKIALTSFILEHSGIPKFIGGIMIGTLFIAAVGSGAGLSLGVANLLNRDFIHRGKEASGPKYERINALLILGFLALAAILTVLIPNDTIQDFTFL